MEPACNNRLVPAQEHMKSEIKGQDRVIKTNMQPLVDHLCKSLQEEHVAFNTETLVIKLLIAALGVFLFRGERDHWRP